MGLLLTNNIASYVIVVRLLCMMMQLMSTLIPAHFLSLFGRYLSFLS